ncbi:type IV secretion system DNA-binding domain-containing protein [Bosea sp. TND4EK4]|uniref:type IV secretion system DNA-binding domain-containing protein n=1 Tax=Bosea sp. TND4EK4 TaxID=1907408 RepID=UPI000955EDE2|nr:type IV secretion system DNA-binding domain-containing protein [Bosea sp. TND4EK4]SIQ83539.1 Type IV secretory pathway, VirD4 component, TraG/TraD family ATPase [Bosea sp. TND4EK4]
MTTHNPFIEMKRVAPAVLGAITAAAIVLVIGSLLLFEIRPPQVVGARGTVDLDLASLAWIGAVMLTSDGCLPVVPYWIGLECQPGVSSRLIGVIAQSHSAKFQLSMLAAAVLSAAAIAFVSIVSATPKREQTKTLKGKRPVFDGDARASLRSAIAKTGRVLKRGLWLVPHVQLTPTVEGYNILALGTQGSGKSSTLRALIEQLVLRGDKTLIHDFKGDMTAGLPSDDFILVAPHDARSWAYDIAADIRNPQHAREFAAHAVPTSAGETMWGDGSRAVWSDLVMALRTDTQGHWGWVELRDALLSPGADIKAVLDRHGAASASRLIFGSEDPEENRTTMSVLITMWIAALTVVHPLAEAWSETPADRRFSLRRWLDDDNSLPRVLILQKSSEYPELTTQLSAFLVDRLVGLALRPGRERNPATKLALCLDELPECGRLRRLPNLLNIGREFGVVTVAAVQDIAHLIELYGESLSRILLARFRIKLVHQLDPGDTAERVAGWLKQRTIEYDGPERYDPAAKRNIRDTVRETAPVLAEDRIETELGVRMEKGQPIVRAMILGFGNPAILDIPATGWPDRRPGHEPAPWLDP